MNAHEAFLHIQRTRIIAILRGPVLGREIDLAESLVSGGITAMEVSTVTCGYAEIIRNLCAHFSFSRCGRRRDGCEQCTIAGRCWRRRLVRRVARD